MAIFGHNVGTDKVIVGNFSTVTQFSFTFGWKVLSFNWILNALNAKDVAILAVSFLENSETALVRCVVNYPDHANEIFVSKKIDFYTTEVLAVEIDSVSDVAKVTNSIFAAEIKMNYMYPFLTRPGGKIGVIVQTENNEFAAKVLHGSGIVTIAQNDIGR
ncbi:MAG: hypothetical protein LBR91_03520 [Puniceicoccales bacterium]|jgi:hypothetical protein|nr:hypothetical protein [Puniceicoccales bacterium]